MKTKFPHYSITVNGTTYSETTARKLGELVSKTAVTNFSFRQNNWLTYTNASCPSCIVRHGEFVFLSKGQLANQITYLLKA